MTKIKSKKMNKSTIAIIVMAIAMVALLAFGGTYAYFTATAKPATTTVNVGKLQLGVTEALTLADKVDNVAPGEYFFGGESTHQAVELGAGETNIGAYVFAKFVAKVMNGASEVVFADGAKALDGNTNIAGQSIITGSVKTTGNWKALTDDTSTTIATANKSVADVYVFTLAKAATTIDNFEFNAKLREDVTGVWTQTAVTDMTGSETTNNTTAEDIMGLQFTVTIEFVAVQSAGLSVQQAALQSGLLSAKA